jgi:hypothetical protein
MGSRIPSLCVSVIMSAPLILSLGARNSGNMPTLFQSLAARSRLCLFRITLNHCVQMHLELTCKAHPLREGRLSHRKEC